MYKSITYYIMFCIFYNVGICTAQVASTQSDSTLKPSGKLWGYTFGDFYYKSHADEFNRGGADQYTNIEKGRNAFQLRRVYLGYNYDIHPRFSAELLLAAEDNLATRTGNTSGDLLSDNKLAFYIKLANIRWKNIWKRTDLIVGQVSTPAFALLVEPIWGYRSVERTITDIRRIPSYDLGVALQGKLDTAGKFGYDLMVSNGSGAKPESNRFKWFAGDVYTKLFNKKLILQLYADFERLNWADSFHHSRSMIKAFAAYSAPSITGGLEAFVNYGYNDIVGVKGTILDTISATSVGISAFVRGKIVTDRLNYFLRADFFNPGIDSDNEQSFDSYKGLTSTFEPNNKEIFMTAGLDYTPIKNVHFIPNIWYTRFSSKRMNVSGSFRHDYDLVYRITFYYVFGR